MGFFGLLFGVWLLHGIFCGYGDSSIQDSDLVEKMQKSDLEVIVMRHGEASNNLSHTLSSAYTSDIRLTENGIEQIRAAAKELAGKKIDWIYVSPLRRAVQTAKILCEELNIPENRIIADDNLAEQYFGDYENRTLDDYIAYFKDPADVFSRAVPNGERGSDVYERTNKFLFSLTSKHTQETILVITHGFNCCHISFNLIGYVDEIPELGHFKIYPFAFNMQQPVESIE